MNKFFLIGKTKVGEPIDWWLANGTIPASTNYTVYDPLDAVDLATSYVNLANPGTRDATVSVAPTQAQGSGWTLNGSTQYVIAGNTFTTTGTLVFWCEDVVGVYIVGSPRLKIQPISGTSSLIQTNGNVFLDGIGSSGIYGVSSGVPPFRNGRKHSANIPTPIHTDLNLYIGCQNNSGSPVNFASGRVLRWAYYDIVLSDAQQEALFNTMRDYNLPAINPISTNILALNPVCYYPMNQDIGGFMVDESGNKANSVIKYSAGNSPTVGHTGLYGNAMQGNINDTNSLQASDNFESITGLSLDNFSWAAWIKNDNADVQTRVMSITDVEYVAFEIRLGLITLYFKENGVTSSYFSVACPDDTWFHLAVSNDDANSLITMYVDGVKYQTAKTTGPFVLPIPVTYPRHMFACTGYIQHIAFFDYILSDANVDSLIP